MHWIIVLNAKMIVLVVAWAAIMLSVATTAQQAKIGVVDVTEGKTTVTRGGTGPRTLGPNEDVLVEDRIVTSSDSSVRIRFAANAVTTITQLSAVRLSEEKGKPVLNLEHGTLVYQPLPGGNRQDDALSILTPNATARAAGAIAVTTQTSNGVVETQVCAMIGNGFASTRGGTEIEVPDRHCVTISGTVLGPIFPRPKPGSGMVSRGRQVDTANADSAGA